MYQYFWMLLSLVLFLGCGSSTQNQPSKEYEEIPTETTEELEQNRTSIAPSTVVSLPSMGKAQLGVMANAKVDLSVWSEEENRWVILATEMTSTGKTLAEIGNFDAHRELLEGEKRYLYTVTGGEDWDVEDDGVLNRSFTPNLGSFHLMAQGEILKQSTTLNVTMVSEILYQKQIADQTTATALLIAELLAEDIGGDGDIDMLDILSYNPIEDKDKLTRTYQEQLDVIVDNILHGRAWNYQAVLFVVPPKTYPKNESGIQEALDAGDYDYVIAELLANRDLYTDLDEDEVNLNIAAAYVGKSGYSVFDITGAISESDEGLNGFIAKVTKENDAVETINQLNEASNYYAKVIEGVDCEHVEELNQTEASACFSLGLVKLTALSNSVKLLFGGDEEIVDRWAEGVEINGSDDLNGNGVIDDADASGCAIVYASNPLNPCRDGSMASYRQRVVFSQNGIEYPTTLIDVDVGSSSWGYRTFKKLLTNNSTGENTALLTDGVCDRSLKKSSNQVDGVEYFPCPVINNGVMMNMAEALDEAAGVQSLFPAQSTTQNTIELYIENITGSRDGVISQDDLGIYLQSH